MNEQDNPFAGAGSQYTANVSYGTAAPAAAENAGTANLGGAGSHVKDTTTAGFTADVIQESRNQPVLVDFWAPWCGPCRQLAPALEKAVQERGGRVKLVKMNIDEHPAVAGQLGIQSIPAVIAFKDGQPVDGFMGALPESQINQFIDKIAGADGEADLAAALAAAGEARASGNPDVAADIYQGILAHAPDNVDALAGLADLMVDAGEQDAARQLLAQVPADRKDTAAVAAVQAKLALAEQSAGLGNPAELEVRLAADPKDYQARFDLAIIQNSRGQRREAADNLLAIVKADRSWKDDGARAQLLQLFEAWGLADEATLEARRKLSSLLFS